MTTLKSYELNGKKLSFANWISNLSPQDTIFTSMTGKEAIDQTLFQWQTDVLASATKNAVVEGGQATSATLASTKIKSNITQILRKAVKVSDTANALANYGRGKELQYQMEKAGQEIKRDLEWTFLHNLHSDATTANKRYTAGFAGLCSTKLTGGKVDFTTTNLAGLGDAKNVTDPDTGAQTVFKIAGTKSSDLAEKDLFDMTMQLYLAGSDANIIMFHPRHASFFAALQEATGGRERIFESTPKVSIHVTTLVDPLGQEYKLIPNRWMPEAGIFFFNVSDWTQMVLRAPERTKLAKDGSYEKWMIEMEVGLRHRNPHASGVLMLQNASSAGQWPAYADAANDATGVEGNPYS